jgi:hypothetical protein
LLIPLKIIDDFFISSMKENTESLVEKVELIAKYYYKGFGASVCGIMDSVDAYLIINDKDKYQGRTLRLLEPINDFYQNIPFNELKTEEFEPMHEINKLLPEFRNMIEKYFEKATKRRAKNIRKKGTQIIEAGRLYDDSLHSILKEIRTNREFKDFEVQIIDYDKQENWYF